MTNLNINKLLVHVPSNLCDGFKTKYVTATTNRNTSYDNKVVFLEKTQEIFTKGKLYGTNIGDFNDLKALIGTIPSGATSTNIIDYINEKINSADHIHSVSKKSGETLIDVATSNKVVTVNSTSALTTAVSNANSAMQSVSFLGKTLNKTINSITVEETKTALGLGSAAYKNTSDFDAAGAASTAAAGVVAKLPVVTNGSGITVTPTTDGNGKTTYTISTSAEVFHYKGNKLTLAELPASGNTTGDVWSVGPADAKGSTLYAWDGDEWINIGGANGITGVDTTASSGVALAKNTNGTVKVNVTPGSIASGNGSVVTGGAVYTAIAAAEERSDAKVLSAIKALDKASSTISGNNIRIKYKEEDGIVTIESVAEDYATITRTSAYNINNYRDFNSAINISYSDKDKLISANDLITFREYALDLAAESVKYSYNYTDSIGSYPYTVISNNKIISLTYSQSRGRVKIDDINVKHSYIGSDSYGNIFLNNSDGVLTGEDFNYIITYGMWETFKG